MPAAARPGPDHCLANVADTVDAADADLAIIGHPPLNTRLALWRDLVRRYPDRDARSLLEDLIALHGRKGKWFAAAKTAGYLDIALDCAADREAAPATLIRAARDFEIKNPAFAAQVALQAIAHLLAGVGYEPSPLDIDVAVGHLMAASGRIGRTAWAIEELTRLAHHDDRNDPMAQRLSLKLAALEASFNIRFGDG